MSRLMCRVSAVAYVVDPDTLSSTPEGRPRAALFMRRETTRTGLPCPPCWWEPEMATFCRANAGLPMAGGRERAR